MIAQSYIPKLFQFNGIEQQQKAFQKVFTEKEGIALDGLRQMARWHKHGDLGFHTQELIQQYYIQGISFFIFENEQLRYWSEDASIIDAKNFASENEVLFSKNAIHYKISQVQGDTTYLALILLKNKYGIENKFLKSHFQSDFQSKDVFEIKAYKEGSLVISDHNAKPKFSLELKEEAKNIWATYFRFVLFLLGLVILFYQLALSMKIQAIYTTALAIIIRFALLFFQADIFQQLELFNPKYLGISALTPSLGDLLLHALFLLYLTLLWIKVLSKNAKPWALMVFTWIGLGLNIYVVKLIESCVELSQISFELNRLFALDSNTLFALLSIALIVFSTLTILRFISFRLGEKWGVKRLVVVIIGLGAFILVAHLSTGIQLQYFWFLPLVFLFLYEYSRPKANPLAFIMLFLIYVSAGQALLLSSSARAKEKQKSIVLIKKLAEEKDPVAEYLFAEIQQLMIEDQILLNQVNTYWENKEKVDQYIRDNYFKGYWNKYQLILTYCEYDDSLYVNEWGANVPCFAYFQDIIRRDGDMISSTNLFQLQNLAGRIDYISEIPLSQNGNNGKLFIELGSNLFNENEGYPELLIDKESMGLNHELDEFSYAVYSQGNLIFKNGEYNYSTQLRINELSDSTLFSYKTKWFQHLAYQKDENTTIILSKKELSHLDLITAIAYLIILYAALYLLLSLVAKNFLFNHEINFRDFTIKIRLFLILSLLSALVLLALGTTYYIKEQYQIKNESQIKEKIRSVNIELENKIGSEEFLSEAFREIVQLYLVKFSNVFYSDINFYTQEGHLYTSSRQEVFEQGLKSKRMHPKAYLELVVNQKAEWVQSEKIGELEYLSAYIPFRNYDNEILGYLNLPYFARQGELEKEISTFLVATINIYIGIFALSLLISILLANQLSKPLLLIRKQIGKLKLGSSIELIEWDSKDEIGALVKEYNRMTIELSVSAEQLAKSEREGAWREMAKQVAHEIKNPLTPMRLSIQHLQRSLETDADNLQERIDKIAKTLIEQIETLSNIASAFSTFAQLPETIITQVDLIEVIKNTVGLYSNELAIEFEHELVQDQCWVNGDKDQLLRLFNNIIKNAVQAVEEEEHAEIKIDMVQDGKYYLVTVNDNGVGIGTDQLHRVFEPNFTTKSSGMGLGLAMSKSIAEQMGGSIQVRSEKGQGTSFIISLPIA